MPSDRFRQLQQRIKQLKESLLPAIDPALSYTPEQMDQMRGFRLLAHAELEVFFEQRVVEIAMASVAAWEVDRLARHPLICLLAYTSKNWPDVPDSKTQSAEAREFAHLHKRVKKALGVFVAQAKDFNHGVKEKNLLSLLLPIGVERDQIDDTWLASMTAYGSFRGAIAHGNLEVQKGLDPASENSTIDGLLNGVAEIDKVLEKLMLFRRIRLPKYTSLRLRLIVAIRILLQWS